MISAPPINTISVGEATDPTATESRFDALKTKLVLVLLTLAVCLAMLEIGLRVTGRYKMGRISGYLEQGAISYVLQRNASKTVFWPGMSWRVYTSDLGFRAERPGVRPLGDKPYYAVLGSSEVFGNGLDYEHTFPGVLAQKIQPAGLDLLNLAIPGHHFMEQDAVFRQFAASTKYKPEVVLICLNPLFIGGYDDIHENTAVRMGELFPREHWKLPLARMILGNSLATYSFFRDAIRNAQAKYLPSKDFALSFYVERYSTRHRFRNPEKTYDFLQRLKNLEAYIRSLNARPVCVYLPTVGGFALNELKAKGQLDPGIESFDTEFFVELARKHCEAEGVQFINAEPMLQKMYDAGQTLNFRGDAHFNEPASRAIGELLYQSLGPAVPSQSQ